MTLTETVRAQTRQAVAELLAAARMRAGDIFIIGCSSSEVVGQRIGRGSSMEAAQAVWEGAAPLLAESGLYLAAQCCEHLNRAIVVERAALPAVGGNGKRRASAPRGRFLCHRRICAHGGPRTGGEHPRGRGH